MPWQPAMPQLPPNIGLIKQMLNIACSAILDEMQGYEAHCQQTAGKLNIILSGEDIQREAKAGF